MAISDKNRARFEHIGLAAIRRELAVGNSYYLPIDPESQREAREWVDEQIALAKIDTQNTRRLITVGTVAGIIAAIAALIAAWPIIKSWLP